MCIRDRYRLTWINVLPERIDLDGAARSYDDLEIVADALRLGGLDCPPPSATKTSDGVTLKFQEVTLQDGRSIKADGKDLF